MIGIAAAIAIATASAALAMNLYRLAKGPDVLDRVLALDTMVINAIALVVLFGIASGSTVSFEAALLFAMVGFLTTVAFCRYLLRGNVIE